VSTSEAACMTGQSESDPMTTATRGVWGVFVTRSSLRIVALAGVVGSAVADNFCRIDGRRQCSVEVTIGGEYVHVSDFTSGTDRFTVGMNFGRRIFLHCQGESPVEIMVFGAQIVFHHSVRCDRIRGAQREAKDCAEVLLKLTG